MGGVEPLQDITEVEVTGPYRLRLTFDDGTVGEVDFSESEWRGVFEPLRDPGYFARDRGQRSWDRDVAKRRRYGPRASLRRHTRENVPPSRLRAPSKWSSRVPRTARVQGCVHPGAVCRTSTLSSTKSPIRLADVWCCSSGYGEARWLSSILRCDRLHPQSWEQSLRPITPKPILGIQIGSTTSLEASAQAIG